MTMVASVVSRRRVVTDGGAGSGGGWRMRAVRVEGNKVVEAGWREVEVVTDCCGYTLWVY
jgi:hypothetical protein